MQPLTLIALDKFAAFSFSNQAWFLNPNKQIWPIRSLHLAAHVLVTQIVHQHWILNEMEIVK